MRPAPGPSSRRAGDVDPASRGAGRPGGPPRLGRGGAARRDPGHRACRAERAGRGGGASSGTRGAAGPAWLSGDVWVVEWKAARGVALPERSRCGTRAGGRPAARHTRRARRSPVAVRCLRVAARAASRCRSTARGRPARAPAAPAAPRGRRSRRSRPAAPGLTPVRTGQASSTRRRGRRARPADRSAAPAAPARSAPMPPTASMTCAAEATSDRPRLLAPAAARGSRPTSPTSPGPGTTMTCLPEPRAPAWPSPARPTARPPRRRPCPRVSAAISRLRTRNRCRSGAQPGGHSLTSRPVSAIRLNSAPLRGRVGPVDAAGQHRHRRRLGGQGAAVRGGVDAEGAAGDDRPAALGQLVAELAGDVLAVGGGGPRPDDRHGPVGQLVQPRRPAHPQRDRRHRARACGRTGRGGRRAPRPSPAVSACSGSAGHSSSSGIDQPRAAALGPARGRRGSRPARRARPTSDADAVRAPPRTASAGPPRPGRRRRRSARSRSCPARRRGSARPAPAAPPGAPRPVAAAGVLQVLVERHAATRCSRMPSASATSSAPGTVRPARSASVHATRSTRSKPRTDSAPAPAPARPAAATPAGPASAPAAAARAPGCSPTARCRASRCGRGRPGRRDPARRRPPWSPAAPRPSSQAARVTGGQVDPQVDPVEQRAGQPRLVAPPLQRAARAGGVAGRARARAGVGGQHELRPAREGGRPRGPVDRHLTRAPAAAAACRAPPGGTRAPRRGTARRGAPGRAPRAGSAPTRRRSATPSWPSGAAPRTWAGVTSGASGGRVPATEWIAVTSSAACSSSGGSSPGSRSASIVLPAPGGPVRNRWCPPAAATSTARRPAAWPDDVAQVGRRRRGPAAGRARARVSGARPARWSTTSASVVGGQHLDAVDQRRLVGVRRRDDDLPVPGPGGGEDGGQHAADAADGAVEPELAQQHQPVDRAARHRPGGGQHRGREREVEAAPLLRHRRRRQPDGDPPLRERRRRR